MKDFRIHIMNISEGRVDHGHILMSAILKITEPVVIYNIINEGFTDKTKVPDLVIKQEHLVMPTKEFNKFIRDTPILNIDKND